MKIRPYQNSDYQQLVSLYEQSELFGGQFDEDRDSEERLRKRIEADPNAILVAERNAELVGSVSIIEDARIAWLFRFAVKNQEDEVTAQLCSAAVTILKDKGRNQVLIYSPQGKRELDKRYQNLGFTKGNDFTCFWKSL